MNQRKYTYRSLHEEREYGLFWYSGLWRVLRPLLVAAASLVAVVGILYSGWNWFYQEYAAPVEASGQEEVAFEVESGQSLTRVANNLESAGLIRSATVFKYYCDFAGLGQKIQAGSYTLRRGMEFPEIAERLTMGDGNPLVRNITLIPGWTVEEFADYLVQKGVLASPDRFLALCRTGQGFQDYYYVADVLSGREVGSRRYVLEGYLAPNTYEIYTTASEEDIIRRLLSQTDRVFPAESQDRAEELGLTMDEVIILASIIEKEAKMGDFAKASAVFHNRLRRGMPLGSDVTVHYATGIRRMALKDSDLSVNSPYNTYIRKGLPVGPICNPSPEAINAALYPDELYLAEGYLYFCSKDPDSGELVFSKTQAEHDRAVSVYRPLWEAWDQQRGLN